MSPAITNACVNVYPSHHNQASKSTSTNPFLKKNKGSSFSGVNPIVKSLLPPVNDPSFCLGESLNAKLPEEVVDPSIKVVNLPMETPGGGYCRQKASQAFPMTGHYSLLIFAVELWAAVLS